MKSKRLLSMLLILAMLALLLPAGVFAATTPYEHDLDLTIPAFDDSVLKDTGITWDKDNAILTLKGATIKGSVTLPAEATIVVEGENVIEGTGDAIIGEGDLTIEGDGDDDVLNIETSSSYAVDIKGSLILQNLSMTIEAKKNGEGVAVDVEGGIEMDNVEMELISKSSGLAAEGNISINASSVTVEAFGIGMTAMGDVIIRDSAVKVAGDSGMALHSVFTGDELIGGMLEIIDSDVLLSAKGTKGPALIVVVFAGDETELEGLVFDQVVLNGTVLDGEDKLVASEALDLGPEGYGKIYAYTPEGAAFTMDLEADGLVIEGATKTLNFKAKVVEGRVAGADRFETAIEISKEAFPNGANVVLIANGMDYPDALAAVPLAYALDGPILLVNGTAGTISDETLAQIENLAPTTIYLLGGEMAVSANIEKTLKNKAYLVERIGGKDRYETAALIAEEYVALVGTYDTAFIASGGNYPDALSGGPAAALNGAPILFVANAEVPKVTEESLKSVTTIYVLGGEAAVSKAIYDKLPGTKERLWGADRYDTGVAINARFFKTTDAIYAATGSNFADALTGGVAAALDDAPVVLVDGVAKAVPKKTTDYITATKATRVVILGGTNAMSDAIAKLLQAAI